VGLATVFPVCKGGRALDPWSYWSYLSQPSLLMGDRKVAVQGSGLRVQGQILGFIV